MTSIGAKMGIRIHLFGAINAKRWEYIERWLTQFGIVQAGGADTGLPLHFVGGTQGRYIDVARGLWHRIPLHAAMLWMPTTTEPGIDAPVALFNTQAWNPTWFAPHAPPPELAEAQRCGLLLYPPTAHGLLWAANQGRKTNWPCWLLPQGAATEDS